MCGEGSRFDILADKSLRPLERVSAHFGFMAVRYEKFGYARGCLIGNLAADSSDDARDLRQALGERLGWWTDRLEEVLVEARTLATSRNPSTPARPLAFLSTLGKAPSSG